MSDTNPSTPAISLGLAGSLPADVVRAAAVAAEEAGFSALWLNDTPGGDALVGLAAAAEATRTLRVATGVIPLDRHAAADVAGRVLELGLPQHRLTLGVGSGAARHPLPLVEAGLAELQARLDAPVLLGALGPRMRRLGARRAAGLLLSWLTPATAAAARDEALADATASGAPTPRLALYVRTTVDPDAVGALETEAARYAGYPSYAANFARIGHGALEATIRGTDRHALAAGVSGYTGTVDELVLRAITVDDSADAIRRFVDAVVEARALS